MLIPDSQEAGFGIVPTTSTTVQLSIGDALAIAAMQYKKFGKLDFKKLHPAGSLGSQLRTVEDIMLTGNKIPFIHEDLNMKTNDSLGLQLVWTLVDQIDGEIKYEYASGSKFIVNFKRD